MYMHLGVGFDPIYTAGFFYHLFLLQVYIGPGNSLLCLSYYVLWMGWVGAGWLGWVLFITFWVWYWGYISFWTFWPSDSHFMHGVWELNYDSSCCCLFFFVFCFLFVFVFFFLLNQVYFYTFAIFVTPIILKVWWGLVLLFCMFSLPPPPNPSTGK